MLHAAMPITARYESFRIAYIPLRSRHSNFTFEAVGAASKNDLIVAI